MFLSHRRAGSVELGAWVEMRAAVHRSFRVHCVRNRRVVSEDELLGRAFTRQGYTGRPVATVVLEGLARVRVGDSERWLGPGDLFMNDAKAPIRMRQEGERFASVAIEWDLGSLGTVRPSPMSCGRLTTEDTMRVARGAAAILGAAGVLDASRAVADVVAILRSAGVAFDTHEAADLVETVPDQTLRLSAALDRALSHLEDSPMAVDLESALRLSARQTNRLVGAFNATYGFNAAGWRDTRGRRRVMVGASLLTVPGATAERVAHTVGYGAPAALWRAFADAGLPAPSEIARTVRGLA